MSISATEVDNLPLELLNEMVAKWVMGESRPVFFAHSPGHILAPAYSDGGNWYCVLDFMEGDICNWKPRNFSANYKAMGLVIEAFRVGKHKQKHRDPVACHIIMQVWESDNNGNDCSCLIQSPTIAPVEGWGKSMPEAVARAALKASLK